jgi:hypothetical protein
MTRALSSKRVGGAPSGPMQIEGFSVTLQLKLAEGGFPCD